MIPTADATCFVYLIKLKTMFVLRTFFLEEYLVKLGKALMAQIYRDMGIHLHFVHVCMVCPP